MVENEWKKYQLLAKKECANIKGQKCIWNNKICKILEKKDCKYFEECVKPLLNIK